MMPTPTTTGQQRDGRNAEQWHDKSYVPPMPMKATRDFNAELRRCIESRINDSTEQFHPQMQDIASELYSAVVEIAELTEEVRRLEGAKAVLIAATAEVINAAVGYFEALQAEGLL